MGPHRHSIYLVWNAAKATILVFTDPSRGIRLNVVPVVVCFVRIKNSEQKIFICFTFIKIIDVIING